VSSGRTRTSPQPPAAERRGGAEGKTHGFLASLLRGPGLRREGRRPCRCCALSELGRGGCPRCPRALPWAGFWRPFRPEHRCPRALPCPRGVALDWLLAALQAGKQDPSPARRAETGQPRATPWGNGQPHILSLSPERAEEPSNEAFPWQRGRGRGLGNAAYSVLLFPLSSIRPLLP